MKVNMQVILEIFWTRLRFEKDVQCYSEVTSFEFSTVESRHNNELGAELTGCCGEVAIAERFQYSEHLDGRHVRYQTPGCYGELANN